MNRDDATSPTPIETERLMLRPWHPADAALHRELWSERDPRVPAHRRLTDQGRPTLAEMETWIRTYDPSPPPGLLVAALKDSGTAIGYCGLITSSVTRFEEPELAYEFLQEFWHRGFATEAAEAIVSRARTTGYGHLVSTVRAWNTASFRVLEKLGFIATGEQEDDEVHGDSIVLRKVL